MSISSSVFSPSWCWGLGILSSSLLVLPRIHCHLRALSQISFAVTCLSLNPIICCRKWTWHKHCLHIVFTRKCTIVQWGVVTVLETIYSSIWPPMESHWLSFHSRLHYGQMCDKLTNDGVEMINESSQRIHWIPLASQITLNVYGTVMYTLDSNVQIVRKCLHISLYKSAYKVISPTQKSKQDKAE